MHTLSRSRRNLVFDRQVIAQDELTLSPFNGALIHAVRAIERLRKP
jgi:hypothetical protein